MSNETEATSLFNLRMVPQGFLIGLLKAVSSWGKTQKSRLAHSLNCVIAHFVIFVYALRILS